jgi:IS30 family transposase
MPVRRRRFTAVEATEAFRRIKQGERLTDVARALGRDAASIHKLLRRHGGIPPRHRKRAETALTLVEREEISRGVKAGESLRSIAERLGRAPSTISRELAKNGGARHYRAVKADERAQARACRPKPSKLESPKLKRVVTEMLEDEWSPEQIAHALKQQYPNNPSMNVSHETIYRAVFVQARGTLKKELIKHLRSGRSMRGAKKTKRTESVLANALSIRERPAQAEDRAIPGHWEGDLIAGYRNQSFIGTLVERSTRFVKLIKVDSKDATDFAAALAREVLRLPAELLRTLTWDQGTEMARHANFTVATGVAVYFCDPHSPWQRGSNENTNGLLRQYFPKGMDLSDLTQKQLDLVAKKLNERPRETLGWRSPADTLRKLLGRSHELLN